MNPDEAVIEACRKLVKVERQRAAELAPVLALADAPELDVEEATLALQSIGQISANAMDRQRRSFRDSFQPLFQEAMEAMPPELLEAITGREEGDEDTTPSGKSEIEGIDPDFVREPERPNEEA